VKAVQTSLALDVNSPDIHVSVTSFDHIYVAIPWL